MTNVTKLIDLKCQIFYTFTLLDIGNRKTQSHGQCLNGNNKRLFVCVEVLRPRQPNGVMSSAVSLPNHTFTGQA